MRTTILTLITVFFAGCAWTNADLGDSYYYLDSFDAYDMGYPHGAIIYKSSQRNSFEQTIISREVVDAKSNDKFIIAKQLQLKNSEDTNIFVSQKDFEKVFKPDTNYYIIDKGNDKVFGPMSADSCERLKTFINVDI